MDDLVVVHGNILGYAYTDRFNELSLYQFLIGVFHARPDNINIRDLHIVANYIDFKGYYD